MSHIFERWPLFLCIRLPTRQETCKSPHQFALLNNMAISNATSATTDLSSIEHIPSSPHVLTLSRLGKEQSQHTRPEQIVVAEVFMQCRRKKISNRVNIRKADVQRGCRIHPLPLNIVSILWHQHCLIFPRISHAPLKKI